jgi:phosphoglycolate phosphatase-like HAD superfamily hydrolase
LRALAGTALLGALLAATGWSSTDTDPLPSWDDGHNKQAIVAFVKAATEPGGARFVPLEDRVVTFDQDGTLWVEHPLYAQAEFALDRVRVLAPQHPEWRNEQPFKAVIAGDTAAIGKLVESDWEKIVAATHAGMSTEAFLGLVEQWLMVARHPRFQRRYTELAYQPMLEVIRYLRASGFKTYIVTGGGQEFVRAYAHAVYGIPPEQVIGSSVLTRLEKEHGKPVLMREPGVFFIDDGDGKPVGINMFIGKRPQAAFGNSAGDAAMLRWTQAGNGVRLEMLVFHDDARREYAYGPAGNLPETKVGAFPGALMDEARKNGWLVISMKKDWKRIFSFEGVASR